MPSSPSSDRFTRPVKKIWIAMGTPFQANFFAPVIEELKDEIEFFITARDHDNIKQILNAKGIPYTTVGRHGGKELEGKLEAYAKNIEGFIPLISKEKPDLMLTERWPEAVRVAFGFDIPAWTIFYDEREKHVNQMVFPLSSKVFAPRFYSFEELYKSGVADPEKIIWFNGFHTGYLKGQSIPKQDAKGKLGVDPPVVLIRPEPDFATFVTGHQPILEKTVEILKKDGAGHDFSLVVLPRSATQKDRYASLGVPSVPESIDEIPLAHVNVAVGAAETMLMEALMLGKPSVSAIYWPVARPVVELHKYITHSTDPHQIARAVHRYLDPEEAERFSQRARILVKGFSNPARLFVDEIRKLAAPLPEQVRARRRSRMEILVDIVQAASYKPCRPTHIMREANISYTEFKDVVESLQRRGLIKSETTYAGRFFQTTSDGMELLTEFRSVKDRLVGESY